MVKKVASITKKRIDRREELPEAMVIPSIIIDKTKELRVGKYVLTVRKLRVLSGIMIPEGIRSRIHGLLGDKVKIDYHKTFAWVNRADVSIE